MSTLLDVRFLEFVRGPLRDRLDSGRLVLDPSTAPFRILMLWRPTIETWVLDLYRTSGQPIVVGAAVRDRTDVLLGVSTPGRPVGALLSYDPRGRGDPTLASYARDGVRFCYVPAGLDPMDFAAFLTTPQDA